ncbi:DEAD-box ATP-dependent RNA helicase 28 [Acorus gramineus]|uniref:DEAD-box ATP-dependent RNA helicase 28 n=1 Tax=Acorus gramineus TaxID=55184 RepID=A0AAV9AES7_ACOGR|nr:DEAD-box ATP-dependent RNA helicase 28 [Acorus gramineus]
MDGEFQFEAGSSDEENETREGNESDQETQSPWDFSSYVGSVGEEYERKNTTSIDYKISRALQEQQFLLPDDDEDEEEEKEKEEEEEELEHSDDGEEDRVTRDDQRTRSSNNEVSGGGAPAFFAPSDGACFHADSFLELNLSRPLLRACEALGYYKPTQIQAACIPLALTGRDICGSATTGSGKTAAFALPVLERLLFRPKRIPAIRVLVLTPTRELAVQVHSMIEKLAQFTDIRCCLIVGGLSMKVQETGLRSMPDIVVATPGRIIDHLRNSQSVGFEDLAVLILDEADRLLEFGFSAEIRELVHLCPKRRQTMLFSATMTEEIDELVKLSLTKPVRLSADPSTMRPATLTEEVIMIRRMREVNQEAILLAICSNAFTSKVIIFSGTKQTAHRLKIIFGLAGLKAAELHGNLTQVQRLDALELFRKQQVDFLIATDVAARGLDIIGVQTVINFACPQNITSYVHRVGRTARAGREGCAVTFVTENDRSLIKAIRKRANSTLLERKVAMKSILKWSQIIEQMEEQISAIFLEEREEKVLRKAEMEAMKAENMIEHKDEIYSRPKKTWFVTEKEKKLIAKTAKASKEKGKNSTAEKSEIMSAEQAEKLKMKEKRRREQEKNLPRKKRRRLEAEREMLEDDARANDVEQKFRSDKKEKVGKSLVDLAYRRAKSLKSITKAHEAGKMAKKAGNLAKHTMKNQKRSEEMLDLFQSDMSEKKQSSSSKKGINAGGRKKAKSSFKSKARYKRRK